MKIPRDQDALHVLVTEEPWRSAAWTGIAVFVALGTTAWFSGNWYGLLQLSFFLSVSLYLVLVDRQLPGLVHFLFIVAAILNAVGWVWNRFEAVTAYDEIAHLYTSFVITLALAFLVFRRARGYLAVHPLDFFLVIVSFGVTLGALWEVIEWSLLVGEFRDSPVSDIVYDALGSLLAGCIAVWLVPRVISREL